MAGILFDFKLDWDVDSLIGLELDWKLDGLLLLLHLLLFLLNVDLELLRKRQLQIHWFWPRVEGNRNLLRLIKHVGVLGLVNDCNDRYLSLLHWCLLDRLDYRFNLDLNFAMFFDR
jgi:hypothetical protein